MTRRVCRSCRYFQAAGHDNMGWCTHPKRRIGSEVRIYVRANELPCRNDWANDLWQAKGDETADVVVDATVAPVLPATEQELGSLAAIANRPKPEGNAADVAARGEDVVVGEVTALSSTTAEATMTDDSRRLRRAHSELRAQKREQRASVSMLPEVSPALPPTESGMWLAEDLIGPAAGPEGDEHVANRDSSHSRQEAGEVSPVALGEIGRPFPKMTTFPEDDARFSSIPVPVDGFELPLAKNREAKRIVGRAGFDDDQDLIAWDHQPRADIDVPPLTASDVDTANDDRVALDVTQPTRRRFIGRQRPKPVRDSLPVADEFLDEFLDQPDRSPFVEGALEVEPRREPAQSTSSLPFEPSFDREYSVTRSNYGTVDPRETARRGDDRVASTRHERWNERPSIETTARPEPKRSRPLVDDIATGLDPIWDPTWEGQRAPVREDVLVAPDEEEITSAEPEHWGTVPRMCRTCRDFRPAENGERGWCTNKWAFSHRRMVDADELPCETSIGGWWLPHDDVWMSAVDVTAHSQPTPLLDQWLAQRAAANGELDIARPVRRRQRS